MTADLRQRLMAAMEAAGNQWFDSYDEEADAVLAVFAAWLRERAESHRRAFGDETTGELALLHAADELGRDDGKAPWSDERDAS